MASRPLTRRHIAVAREEERLCYLDEHSVSDSGAFAAEEYLTLSLLLSLLVCTEQTLSLPLSCSQALVHKRSWIDAFSI